MIDCMTCLTIKHEYLMPHGVHRDDTGVMHGTVRSVIGDLRRAWIMCDETLGQADVPWVRCDDSAGQADALWAEDPR